MLKNLISYYRSCYQADYRAISLSNFFGSKAENTLILENADLISGKLLAYPVATKWGSAITKKLAIYAQEKELYCGAFFLFGAMMVGGRKLDVKSIEPDEVLIAFPIAGIEIDIVVIKNQQTYCIDLIGFPGVFEEALSLERWRMLERVGLRIFYLPFSQWHYDKDLCKQAILNFLGKTKIFTA